MMFHPKQSNIDFQQGLKMKKARQGLFYQVSRGTHTEKEEPQPQVDTAFGFLITNWEPSMLS